MRRILTALLSLALFGAGCSGEESPSERSENGRQHLGVVVTRDTEGIPSTCRPKAVALELATFTEALRRGDTKRLRQYWVPGYFDFFALNREEEGGPGERLVWARNPDDAIDFVEKEGHVPIRLSEIEILDVDREGGRIGADLAMGGRWGAGKDTEHVAGKGFYVCERRQTAVLAWGTSIQARQIDVVDCPPPGRSDRGSSRDILVCASERLARGKEHGSG